MVVRKNTRTYQILKLLSDGRVHKTTDIRRPSKTRGHPSSQSDDRHNWFYATVRKGYAEKSSKWMESPSKYKITKKGKEAFKKAK